jgi:hypothetical protein
VSIGVKELREKRDLTAMLCRKGVRSGRLNRGNKNRVLCMTPYDAATVLLQYRYPSIASTAFARVLRSTGRSPQAAAVSTLAESLSLP